MDDLDKLMFLRRVGMWSEGIGPLQEWQPLPLNLHQERHAQFWGFVTGFLEAQPEGYDDLPEWMTEDATMMLEANTKL